PVERMHAAFDGPLPVERRLHAVDRVHPEESIRRLLVRVPPAVLRDRAGSLDELLDARARPDLELHQKGSGQYGGSSVRKSAEARATAPSASSSTRPAAASRSKENAPRYAEARSATGRRRSGSSSVGPGAWP